MIAVLDRDVLHALRDNKVHPLPQSVYARLPELLRRASALLLARDVGVKRLLLPGGRRNPHTMAPHWKPPGRQLYFPGRHGQQQRQFAR